MKLNMDCVRAVMLCVEEHTDFDHYCYFIRYARADILDMLDEEPIDPPTYQVELEAKFDNDNILYSLGSNRCHPACLSISRISHA